MEIALLAYLVVLSYGQIYTYFEMTKGQQRLSRTLEDIRLVYKQARWHDVKAEPQCKKKSCTKKEN